MLRLLLLLLLMFNQSLPSYAKEPIRTLDGMVTKVSDGDTIHVRDSLGNKVKIRMDGIDAPETEKSNRKTGRVSKPGQPYGEEAFQALKSKIGGRRVKVEVMDIDKYRRAVSIIWLDNRNINLEMVREGFAWAYRQYLDPDYAADFLRAEELAKKERRGLWQQNNPQPPWEFRHSLKEGKRGRKAW